VLTLWASYCPYVFDSSFPDYRHAVLHCSLSQNDNVSVLWSLRFVCVCVCVCVCVRACVRVCSAHLSFPLFLGSADDLLVSVGHHSDEHVQQQDRHQHGECYVHRFRQCRQTRVVKLVILYERTPCISTRDPSGTNYRLGLLLFRGYKNSCTITITITSNYNYE